MVLVVLDYLLLYSQGRGREEEEEEEKREDRGAWDGIIEDQGFRRAFICGAKIKSKVL